MVLQDKKAFAADVRICTQNTQMVLRGSRAVNHAFDFRAQLAEYMPPQIIPPVAICVYLRASSYICVKCFLGDAAYGCPRS
jgi:hypothetical protein